MTEARQKGDLASAQATQASPISGTDRLFLGTGFAKISPLQGKTLQVSNVALCLAGGLSSLFFAYFLPVFGLFLVGGRGGGLAKPGFPGLFL